MDEEMTQNTEEVAPKEEGLVVYEVGYHIVPTIAEEKLTDIIKNIGDSIQKNNGKIISEGAPHKIDLAYIMKQNMGGSYKHFDDAYFGWIKFEMPTISANSLKEDLDGNENILRMLIVKTVREDTMSKRVFIQPTRQSAPIKKPVAVEESAPVSEEELDKSIEEMVAEK